MQLVALACLFLAGKAEESTKKMKEFVNVARLVPMLQGRLSTKEVRG